jgi:enoyl-CoA hydratase/carnithine racemase
VTTLLFDQPAKRNALTMDMWREIPVLLDRVAADPGNRVLILTGAGTDFSAGADIDDLPADPAEFDAVHVTAEAAVANFPRPTIAAVQGVCVGGGCELAVACDIRLAAAGARIGITAARLGIIYPVTATQRLVQLVGPARARMLLYTGRVMTVEWALRAGLVDEIVQGDVVVAARDLASGIAAQSSIAVAAAKQAISRPEAFRTGTWWTDVAAEGHYDEGRAAFRNRRAPVFRAGSGQR